LLLVLGAVASILVWQRKVQSWQWGMQGLRREVAVRVDLLLVLRPVRSQ
jgi:hypothetical protein